MADGPDGAVVIGVSAGGIQALRILLAALPASFPLPVAIVLHRDPHANDFLSRYFSEHTPLVVKEADDQEFLQAGVVYLAPANYHLLIEGEGTFGLSIDAPVNFARPAVDVLFESAAEVYGARLIGVVLTGANDDGARGARRIKERGGLVLVQAPEEAEVAEMPRSTMAACPVDYVAPLAEMAGLLQRLAQEIMTG